MSEWLLYSTNTSLIFHSYHYKYTFCFTKQGYNLLYPEQTLWVRTGWKVGISLTDLTLQHFCACPKFAPEFPTPFVSWSFCVLWLEVRCGYFFSWYIGVIVHHHCITFSYFDMEQFFCPLMEKQHISKLSLWSDRRTRYLLSF